MKKNLYYCSGGVSDTILKPCTADVFNAIVDSEHTEKLVQAYRNDAPEKESKLRLPLLYYQGVLDQEKYQDYCQKCMEQGQKPKGSRNSEFMLPVDRLMLDWDHENNPQALFQRIMDKLEEKDMLKHLLLAHVTPSGKGLRAVMETPAETKDMSIEETQKWWCHLLEVPDTDPKCKDICRGSFAPTRKDIFLVDERLFSPHVVTPIEKPSLTTPAPPVAEECKTLAQQGTSCTNLPNHERLIMELERELGGLPREGERNNFLLKMAQCLAIVCGRSPDKLMQMLPHYGQEESEFRSTVHSACNYDFNLTYQQIVDRVLDRLQGVCGMHALPPEMPQEQMLPTSLRVLVKGTPEECKQALTIQSFSAWATYLYDVSFMDASERPTEVAFFTLCIGESGTGKSALDHPLDCILKKVKNRDEMNRNTIESWKRECRLASKSKDKPKPPQNCIVQCIGTNLTHAAFMKMMQEAKGRALYIHTPELDALKHINDGKDPLSLLREADDHAFHGQERASIEAESINVKLYLHVAAASTPRQAQDFFRRGVAKGNLGRLSLSTIVKDKDDWGEEIPVFENQTEEYAQSLLPFVERLEQAHGLYNLPEAKDWARKLQSYLAGKAREHNDMVYKNLIGRAVKSGFWRAMMLYIMEGEQWTKEIEDFAAWSVEYDLWCKMHFFGTELRRQLLAETPTPRSTTNRDVLAQMPNTFSREDIRREYILRGKSKSQADSALSQWVRRGKLTLDKEKHVFTKN